MRKERSIAGRCEFSIQKEPKYLAGARLKWMLEMVLQGCFLLSKCSLRVRAAVHSGGKIILERKRSQMPRDLAAAA